MEGPVGKEILTNDIFLSHKLRLHGNSEVEQQLWSVFQENSLTQGKGADVSSRVLYLIPRYLEMRWLKRIHSSATRPRASASGGLSSPESLRSQFNLTAFIYRTLYSK